MGDRNRGRRRLLRMDVPLARPGPPQPAEEAQPRPAGFPRHPRGHRPLGAAFQKRVGARLRALRGTGIGGDDHGPPRDAPGSLPARRLHCSSKAGPFGEHRHLRHGSPPVRGAGDPDRRGAPGDRQGDKARARRAGAARCRQGVAEGLLRRHDDHAAGHHRPHDRRHALRQSRRFRPHFRWLR